MNIKPGFSNFSISQDKLTAIIKWYKENGLTPRKKRAGGNSNNTKVLKFDDIKRIVSFITSYAEDHALDLPGRVSSHARADIQLLPSSTSKAEIYRLYVLSMNQLELRCVADSTFRSLWLELLPRIVLSRPMTDLCWECQRNNRAISVTSNLPDIVKQAKLKKQQQHLEVVHQERKVYQDMVNSSKLTLQHSGMQLGPNQPCTSQNVGHYSFDFAQQVHLPHDPLQPGPMYFLCPRKVGLFGVCCEGIP